MQRRGANLGPGKRRPIDKPKGRRAPRAHASIAGLQEQLDRRTHERDEALEQQTATADVLKVISRSSFSLDHALNALIESATRLCGAMRGHILQFNGEFLVFAAAYGAFPGFTEYLRAHPFRPGLGTIAGRAAASRQTVHVRDVLKERGYELTGLVKQQGYRTVLAVPMLREEVLLGVITILKTNVEPFTKKQIELVETFANQAVIAIENTRLLNELRESLQRQTATADVLKVISSSLGELEPVFNAMLANATRICEATIGTLYLYEGTQFRGVALHHSKQSYVDYWQRNSVIELKKHTGTPLDRLASTKRVVHIPDLSSDRSYLEKKGRIVALVEDAGVRTFVSVPMIKEGELVGAINLYRQEVRPFTDKQIELVQNFAAQAVIAIENARLLNELRQRTNDLTESLEQQTATSKVLQIISKSPGELEPVFEAVLGNAVRICGAKFGNMWLRDGDGFRIGAMHGTPQPYADFVRSQGVFHPDPRAGLGTALRTKQPFQFKDAAAVPTHGDKALLAIVDLAHARTLIGVPMLKDNEVIGAIGIYRQEVRPFTEKQIELVKNFAAQAVIAIENTRLLSELRESLQQQTATADVLKVISRSTFDLKTVLTNLVETAVRVCEADIGNIARPIDGDTYKIEANYGQSTALYEELARQTLRIGKGSVIGRTALSRAPVHILDAQTDPDYELRAAREIGDYHTMLGVPMVREGNIIGVFGLARNAVRAFTEKQIELVTTFADQAVIAIENVRLFENVETRTRELAQSLDNLRTTQDRLVQTQKLASLGQLTAGIAHEIKNPLNFVNNFSGLSSELIDELQQSFKDVGLTDPKRDEITELMNTLRSNLDKVVQHGKRADAIVKNMLMHSHQGSGEHRPVAINTIVEESLKLAYHGARAEKQNFNVMVEQSLDPVAGEVDAFPQEITRALLNLISNGVYATREKAPCDGENYKPTLTASTKSLGDHVEIRIRDNGIGIPREIKEQIFNPFFTTKPAGEGTGLGLSISHDIIVKQHGGSIEVETQPGEFTEVRIVLPRTLAIPK